MWKYHSAIKSVFVANISGACYKTVEKSSCRIGIQIFLYRFGQIRLQKLANVNVNQCQCQSNIYIAPITKGRI